jgi:hypothetical protein
MSRSIVEEEAVLRRVNDAIRRGLWPGEDGNLVRIRCECGRLGCNARIQLRAGEYEWVRDNPRRFVIREGHETPEVEVVVARVGGYVVVEKTGAAARSAEAADPRADCTG